MSMFQGLQNSRSRPSSFCSTCSWQQNRIPSLQKVTNSHYEGDSLNRYFISALACTRLTRAQCSHRRTGSFLFLFLFSSAFVAPLFSPLQSTARRLLSPQLLSSPSVFSPEGSRQYGAPLSVKTPLSLARRVVAAKTLSGGDMTPLLVRLTRLGLHRQRCSASFGCPYPKPF